MRSIYVCDNLMLRVCVHMSIGQFRIFFHPSKSRVVPPLATMAANLGRICGSKLLGSVGAVGLQQVLQLLIQLFSNKHEIWLGNGSKRRRKHCSWLPKIMYFQNLCKNLKYFWKFL